MADLTITPADVLRQGTAGVYRAVQFGEAISAGEVVYQSTSDQKYYKADATDATKPASTSQIGIAVSSAAADQQGVVAKSNATLNVGAGVMVAGTVYVSSSNAVGKIAPAADLATAADLSIIGYATTDELLTLSLNVTGVAKA